jgi:hypothetical protein
MYLVGYPSAGYWDTANGGLARGQWACSTTYDGEYMAAGSGYYLWDRCSMNQGASGGPQFVKLSDGSWTIGGVTNVCYGGNFVDGHGCQPYGDWIGGVYFNENFLAFWQSAVV